MSLGSRLRRWFGAKPAFEPPVARPGEAIGFGYKCAWLAIRDRTPAQVIAAVPVKDARAASWTDGIDAAYEGRLFVTPAIDGWVLVAGKIFDALDPPRITALSRALDTDVQGFVSHRVVEQHAWMWARAGVMVRAFGYLGESDQILFDDGAPTDAELAIGDDVRAPDEDILMQIAGAWSVDPVGLDGREVGDGWIGELG